MAGIVEIGDYTIEAEWFDRYKVWAETAVPWQRPIWTSLIFGLMTVLRRT